MKDNLLKIINNYGTLPQLKYFQTEVFELNESIIDYESEQSFKDLLDIKILDSDIEKKKHIAEELADVLVMLLQFKEYYKIPDNLIESIMKYKIDRQLKRIVGDPS